MDSKRDDEQEGEEETNQLAAEADDQLKIERTRADEQDGEETEEMKNLTQLYYELIADLMDDIGASEQYFWEEDSDSARGSGLDLQKWVRPLSYYSQYEHSYL